MSEQNGVRLLEKPLAEALAELKPPRWIKQKVRSDLQGTVVEFVQDVTVKGQPIAKGTHALLVAEHWQWEMGVPQHVRLLEVRVLLDGKPTTLHFKPERFESVGREQLSPTGEKVSGCWKCGGTGLHWAVWVDNGICWGCGGRGIVATKETKMKDPDVFVDETGTYDVNDYGDTEGDRERAIALDLGFHPSELDGEFEKTHCKSCSDGPLEDVRLNSKGYCPKCQAILDRDEVPLPEAPPEDEDPFVSEPAARPRLQTREPKITEEEVKASVEFQTPPPTTPAPVQPTIQGRLVKPARTVAPTAPTQETGKTERVCSECNCLITFAVNSYSKQHFGRPLCMKHQGEVRREQREAEYQATLPEPPPAPKSQPKMINGRWVK